MNDIERLNTKEIERIHTKETIFFEFEESDISVGVYVNKPDEIIFHTCYKKVHYQVIINFEPDKPSYILSPFIYGDMVQAIPLNTLTEVINTIYNISELNEKGEY